jgi:hypothetical protein
MAAIAASIVARPPSCRSRRGPDPPPTSAPENGSCPTAPLGRTVSGGRTAPRSGTRRSRKLHDRLTAARPRSSATSPRIGHARPARPPQPPRRRAGSHPSPQQRARRSTISRNSSGVRLSCSMRHDSRRARSGSEGRRST